MSGESKLDKLRGRRPKLTNEVLKTVVEAIAQGHYRTVAAKYANVSPRMLHRWMSEGRKRPDSIYGYFRTKVKEAEAVSELNLLAIVQRAAQNDAKHAEWLLARRFPKRWSRQRESGPSPESRPATLTVVVQGIAASTSGNVGHADQQSQAGKMTETDLQKGLPAPIANGAGSLRAE
jgi:hypothetical protein